MNLLHRDERLLLIDTCGESASVGLSAGHALICRHALPQRSSALLLGAVRGLLQEAGWALSDLDGIGLVNGPGSFTGVRAGLAAAKGLCEAAALPLAAVSRLAVLAEAVGSRQRFAVLSAGRDELYVRDHREGAAPREFLCRLEDFKTMAAGLRVVVAEQRVAEALAELAPVLHTLQLDDAVAPALRCLREGGSDVVLTDANYVRGEGDIYRKAPPPNAAVC